MWYGLLLGAFIAQAPVVGEALEALRQKEGCRQVVSPALQNKKRLPPAPREINRFYMVKPECIHQDAGA